MKTRKITMGLTALALVGAMALPVSAAQPQTGTTDITAIVTSSYTLSIPQKTDINFEATSTALTDPLKVTGNVAHGETVTVSAQCNPLKTAQDDELAYTLMNGSSAYTPVTWTETELRDGKKEVQLSVAIDDTTWKNAKAGTYTGGIVFTAELK